MYDMLLKEADNMSKFYEAYLNLKRKNSEKLYLFRMGNFYIFLADDAKRVSTVTTLKITNFNNDVVKCGFPVIAKDKYLEIFQNIHLNVEVIEALPKDSKKDRIDPILAKIKKLNVNTITSMRAMGYLEELVVVLNER